MSEDYRTSLEQFHDFQDDSVPHVHACADASPEDVARLKATRRTFIKGVIASGAGVSSAGYLFRNNITEAQAQARVAPGAVTKLVSLKVNGQTRQVDVAPHETLANTLRYKLGLTGTKLACDRGECGACTVSVNNVAYYSCTTLTHSVADAEITTVEGLRSANGDLHPLQKAFVEELAPQCGFCTPGQLMSAYVLLKSTPKPTIDQVRHGMSGNLCRCGAYDHYTKAVLKAAGGA